MRLPVQITFRNMTRSATIEQWVRAEVDRLDRFFDRIMSCRVAVEIPHHHHRKGSSYHVRIDVKVPGEEIVVKRAPTLAARLRRLGEAEIKKRLEVEVPHKNLRAAIHDAFKAAGRRLQDYARRQRGDVKSHAPLQTARVSKILPDKGYGFLTSDDGRGIYFHKNSVLHGAFSRMKVGTTVSFHEERGEKGPQASALSILRMVRNPVGAKRAATLAESEARPV